MLLARKISRRHAEAAPAARGRPATGYRADVDGLRAVAVLPVVLFHAGVPGFGGGFVGVDVFFVISGYLITSILLGDLEAGRFSLLSFYDRRVRRIFPALFAVLAATVAAGLLLLLPEDLAGLGRSLAAAALFGSNVLFWREAGYFDGAAEDKPLLHTWSLAVEEQFYVAFPLLVLVLFRLGRGRALHLTLPVLLALSFALAVAAVERKPEAAFYLAPTRAWELLLGALLATGALPAIGSRRARDALSLLGLGMVLGSVVLLSAETPFPGAAALLPCLGAALVIHAGVGGGSAAGRALGVEPLVLVGLASYSLYLWHWPVLVLARYWAVRELTWPETAAALALSAVLALLSWRFVERPFRGRGGLIASRPRLFAAAGAATAAALAVGAGLHLTGGLPSRVPPEAARLAAGAADRDSQACLVLPGGASRSADPCRIGAAAAGSGPGFVLWGDSHAWALMGALGQAGAEAGRAGLVMAHSLCPPLLGVDVGLLAPGACPGLNAAALARVASDPGIDTVVLAARWPYYATGRLYGREPGKAVALSDGGAAGPTASNEAVFRRGLERTVAALGAAGKRVVVVGPVPETGLPVPSALARSAWFGRPAEDLRPPLAGFEARNRAVLDALAGLGSRPGVEVVYPHAPLCDGPASACRVEEGGRPLYSDDNHLSLHGQAFVRPLFAGRL